MFLTKINPFQNCIISRTHIYMFQMFYMFHDGGVTFIFYSLLNLIVYFMFPTKIKPFKTDYFMNAYLYVSYVLYVSWRRRNVYILFSSKFDRLSYVSNQHKAVSKLIISRTHIYMFDMFYMFHDGGVTFIFYSLLNLIVFLMFPTKIKPFQKWSFQERTFVCFICFICFMTEA